MGKGFLHLRKKLFMKKILSLVAVAVVGNAKAQNMEGKVVAPTTVKEGKES